jgi:hypothetical protein
MQFIRRAHEGILFYIKKNIDPTSVEWLTLLLRIREVAGSNLSPDTA